MNTDIDAILARRAELKARDPGAILLFRAEDEHGDLYRAFAEDVDMLRGGVILPVPYFCQEDVIRKIEWIGIMPHLLDKSLARIKAAGKRAAVVEPHKGPAPPGAEVERIATPGAIEPPSSDDVCPACGAPTETVSFDRYRCDRCGYEGRNKDRHLSRRSGPVERIATPGPSPAAALIARARTNAYQLTINRRATAAERDLARLLFDLADAVEAGAAGGGEP